MLTSISLPTFFLRKTTKFLLETLTSALRHKEDRRRLNVVHKGQRGSRSPYSAQPPARPPPMRPRRGVAREAASHGIHFCDSTSIIARSGSGDAPHNASR